jgi:competence protein ComEC
MDFKEKIIIAVCAVLFVGIFLAQNYFKLQSRIVFCDVGQGDGAFINLKDGVQIAIDGGPDNNFIGCIGEYMPYFDRRVEYLIVSHPDKDHFVGAIEILKRYDVQKVIISGEDGDSPEYEEFLRLSKDKITASEDFEIAGAKIFFYKIAGTKLSGNDKSLVFKFLYGEKSILFTGDISEKGESALLASGVNIKSDILKIAHHGSRESSSRDFLRAVSPRLAIISVGAENKYGHPAYIILKRLESLGIKYFRTDESGDIIRGFDNTADF